MITDLATPFVDATPDALSLHMGLDTIDALATTTIVLGNIHVELRLLSASHQIFVRRERQLICSETLACLRGSNRSQDAMLPRSYVESLDQCRYHFSSSTMVLDDEQLERRVRSTIALMDTDSRALVGRFPGSPLSITGIAVTSLDTTSTSWTTMHAYPQHRTIIETTTRVTLVSDPTRPQRAEQNALTERHP